MMRETLLWPGVLGLACVLALAACVSRKPGEKSRESSVAAQKVESSVRVKAPKRNVPKPKVAEQVPGQRAHRAGVRVSFREDRPAWGEAKLAVVKGGETYEETLPSLSSARMCCIRLIVLCERGGMKAEMDPPFAVRIYEEGVRVRGTNVVFAAEKFPASGPEPSL